MIQPSFQRLVALVMMLFCSNRGIAGTPESRPQLEQRLGQSLTQGLLFKDEHGVDLTLPQLLAGRPMLLVPVYYTCPNVCNMTLEHLGRSLSAMQKGSSGLPIHVVVLSIDPRDSPSRAEAKKRALASHMEDASQISQWNFLTADKTAIKTLLADLGIPFSYDPETKEFSHPSVAVALTPGGRIDQYLYGPEFAPADLRRAVDQADAGRIGSPVTRFLVYCFHFDPRYSRYGAIITNSVRACGLLSLLGLGTLVVWLGRRVRFRVSRSGTV